MTAEIEDALRSASEAVLSVVLPIVELATSLLRAGWPVLVGIGLAVAVGVMVLSAIVRAFSAEARHKRRLRTADCGRGRRGTSAPTSSLSGS